MLLIRRWVNNIIWLFQSWKAPGLSHLSPSIIRLLTSLNDFLCRWRRTRWCPASWTRRPSPGTARRSRSSPSRSSPPVKERYDVERDEMETGMKCSWRYSRQRGGWLGWDRTVSRAEGECVIANVTDVRCWFFVVFYQNNDLLPPHQSHRGETAAFTRLLHAPWHPSELGRKKREWKYGAHDEESGWNWLSWWFLFAGYCYSHYEIMISYNDSLMHKLIVLPCRQFM